MSKLASLAFLLISFNSLFTSALAFPRKRASTFIVGGEPALLGELPYQVALYRRDVQGCGGSFVIVQNQHVIITAAHCVSRYTADELQVVAGDVNLNTTTGTEQRRQVTRILSHANYSSETYANDISILLLDQPFNINQYVQPIPLPPQGQVTKGDVLVSGWGKLDYDSDFYPHWLNKVVVPIMSDYECAWRYWWDMKIKIYPYVMICAGIGGWGGVDSCSGDSGGPAKAIPGGYLAGIVSWGLYCAHPDFPGVYTEVSAFVTWVEETVANYQ